MLNQTPVSVYARALTEARNQLRDLRVEIEGMVKLSAQLEAFIANAEPLVPEPDKASPVLEFPTAENREESSGIKVETPQMPLWKLLTLAINGKGLSFSVKDALEALERIGRPITSPNKFQIVRNAILHKENVFRQIGPGLYAVRKVEEEAVVEIPEVTGAEIVSSVN